MTVRFLADENFNHRIVLGLRRRDDAIDIALVQDVGREQRTILPSWNGRPKLVGSC